MITSPKIKPRHLRLRALVYVRQSTPQQLQNNQESTCGRCGRQMGVGYRHGAPRYHCRGAQNAYGEPQCQSVAVRDIDQAVSSAFLDAVQPAGIEAMLVAIERLEDERRAIDRQWQLRLERARYDARLAQ